MARYALCSGVIKIVFRFIFMFFLFVRNYIFLSLQLYDVAHILLVICPYFAKDLNKMWSNEHILAQKVH